MAKAVVARCYFMNASIKGESVPEGDPYLLSPMVRLLSKNNFYEVIIVIDVTLWMKDFLLALHDAFGARVWFVGLQGSYARGEATEESDIDIAVILDEASASDVATYNALLDGLPHREKVCGFFSGKNEILNWEPSDLFQFCHDTRPIKGSLEELFPLLDANAVARAIKIGVCNIYHGCVHNMLYEKSEEVLRGLYKSASFVVQAICFAQTGRYISRQRDLSEAVSPDERVIVKTFLTLKNGGAVDFVAASEELFAWSKGWIGREEPSHRT